MSELLIVNARIVTMAGKTYENGFLYARDGKIAELGAMADCTLEGKVEPAIDAQGKTLFPGMIDAHCHVGMWEDSMGFEGADGNEATEPLTPQLRAIDAINPYDRYIADARKAGITTLVTGPGSTNIVGGQFAAIKTRGRSIDDMILKAPLAMKVALGENPKKAYKARNQAPTTRMATAAILREFLQNSLNYKRKKEAHLADPEKNKEPDYNFKYESMLDVMDGKLLVKIHAHRADDICTAIRIAKEFHLDFTIEHATEGHLIADILKENNVNVNLGPTLSDRSKPELKNMTYATYQTLAEAGLRIATITDHPVIPIEYLPLSAALAVKNGLCREDALHSLTINAAENCRIADRVGSLEIGKDADMCLYSGDILDLYNKPELVIINGEICSE